MEEQNEVIKEKINEHFLGGIIGAIIGGLIGAIPWTLMYAFLFVNSALFAILVGFCAIKGYTLFKGKINNKTKIIVSVISLVILVTIDLLIIPLIYTYTNSVDLNAYYTELKSEIIESLIFTLLFGFVGIYYAINKINAILIKQQMLEENHSKELSEKEISRQAEINSSLSKDKKEDLGILRAVFGRLNALNKKTAVEKQVIVDELQKENVEDIEKFFKKYYSNFWSAGLIKKYKGKYYYQKKNEMLLTRSYWVWFALAMFIVAMNNATDNIETDYDNPINLNTITSTQSDILYDFNGENITMTIPLGFTISSEKDLFVIEKENSYATIYVYPKEELIEGLTLGDLATYVAKNIYSVYPVEEEKVMNVYTDLNKASYKLSFEAIDGIYKVIVNSYITETENYVIEMHAVSEINKAAENELKFENMLNSLVEK